MERLIKKHFGIYVPTAMINKNTSAVKPCGSTCNEYREDCGICPIRTVFNRLAEYEATGLTPQEIMEFKDRLLRELDFAINATNRKDHYSIGMVNGLTYAKALVDDKDPVFTKDVSDWISVSERLPDSTGTYDMYLVTLQGELIEDKELFTGVCGFEDGEWEDDNVLAWMPLPEPWKGE